MSTPNALAGQTLAQLATLGDTPAVRAELQARIARNGKSSKRAAEALARLDAGGSVAIPERPKAEPKPKTTPKRTSKTTPLSAGGKTPADVPAVVFNAGTGTSRPVVSQAQACKLAADLLRSHGYSVPRALTTLAKGRNLAPRVKAA